MYVCCFVPDEGFFIKSSTAETVHCILQDIGVTVFFYWCLCTNSPRDNQIHRCHVITYVAFIEGLLGKLMGKKAFGDDEGE